MENQKKVWQTKEFREAKKNFELEKKCFQCGSKENLTPHHIYSFNTLKEWKFREVAIMEICKIKGVTFYPSSITNNGGVQTRCNGVKGYIPAQELKNFIIAHQDEFKEKSIKLAEQEYYSFNNIQTLCKRCHFAGHKEMVLCGICKKKYHSIDFPSCYDCKDKWEEGYKKFEKEMDESHYGHIDIKAQN